MNIQAQIMIYAVKERRHTEGMDGCFREVREGSQELLSLPKLFQEV